MVSSKKYAGLIARLLLCDGYSSKKDAGLTARSFLCDGYSSKKDTGMVTVARKMLVSLPVSFCVAVTVARRMLGWLQ